MKQQNNNQNWLINAANTLYGAQRKKDEEEKSLRNSLLNELGDKAEAKHILYSSNDELKKMKGKLTGAADSINSLKAPLPGNGKQTSSPQNNNEIKEPDLSHKAKLLDKIPVEKGAKNYEIEPIKCYLNFDEGVGEREDVVEMQDAQTRFDSIMKHIYNTEGGFVDDPDNRGGRTNKGVTQRVYDAYNKKNGLPLKDVKDITKEEATEFYKKEYWEASGANKIKDKNMSYMHYDAAINHGVGRAKKFLEQSGGDFDKYYQARKAFYDEIVKNNPSQQKYYKGWMNRIEKIDRIRKENSLD